MKKLIILIFVLFSINLYSQKSDVILTFENLFQYENGCNEEFGVKTDSTIRFNDDICVGGDIISYGLTVYQNGEVRGDSYLRGSYVMGGNLSRIAIYIPGALPSDFYAVSSHVQTQYQRPLPGDNLTYFAKNDSLIIMRENGETGTWNLGITYIRIK